ncbi:Ubiquitin C-terminal hydrolase 13 [Linum grandiflorum]
MAAKDKFAWRIENFSKLTETAAIYSDTFSLNGLQWKIRLNPVGIAKCMSAYLEFVDSKIVPDGWSLVVDFTLTLVDQLKGTSSLQISEKRNFVKGTREGYKFRAQIGELGQKGFLVDDTIVIEAELSTLRFIDPNLSAKLYTALETLRTRHYSPKTFEIKLTKYGDEVLDTIRSTVSEYYSDFCKHEGNGCSEDSGDPRVARTSTVTSPGSLTVQLASKNLIAELSAMAPDWNPALVDTITDENLLQQQRDKLAEYFEMSLEEISKANLYYEAREVVRKISELASDPFERSVMKDLLARGSDFGLKMYEALSIIERTPEFETTPEHQRTMKLEESLLKRQKQLKNLDSEVSRIEEERTKLEAEIQLLVARNDELVQKKKSAVAEIGVANRDASKELQELKRKHRDRELVNETRMGARERIAQTNASWKLFKEIWYSKINGGL